MINMTTNNFLIILLHLYLLNASNILLSMETPNEKPNAIYIEYTDTPGKYCIIPKVNLCNAYMDFTKSFEELYAKTNLHLEDKNTHFLLELYHYNNAMLYKTMRLNPPQVIEIITQQKNKNPIVMLGSIPKSTMLNDKKMEFTYETKFFKLNFSPPPTIVSSLYQKEITTIEKELTNDKKNVRALEKTTKFEQTLLDTIIILEQNLKKLKLETLNNMIESDKKILEKIEQEIALGKKITELELILQEKNALKSQVDKYATILFLTGKITIMIAYALAHNTLLPLLFFTNIITSLLYYSYQI